MPTKHDENNYDERQLAVFEEQADATIRRANVEGVWFFSVVDVIAFLTDSTAPRQYWLDTKKRMKQTEAWDELSENILQLRLQSRDGKFYRTEAASTRTLFRVIQSVPSPKAEPIKLWLAHVGADTIERNGPPVVEAPPPSSPIAVAWAQEKPADGDLLGWAAWLEKLALVYRQQASLESGCAPLKLPPEVMTRGWRIWN